MLYIFAMYMADTLRLLHKTPEQVAADPDPAKRGIVICRLFGYDYVYQRLASGQFTLACGEQEPTERIQELL